MIRPFDQPGEPALHRRGRFNLRWLSSARPNRCAKAGVVVTFALVAILLLADLRVTVHAQDAEGEEEATPVVTAAGRIVFQQASGGDLYVMNADGSDLRVFGQGIEPALSPDGTRIIYSKWEPQPGLYVYNLESGSTSRYYTVAGARWPSWSPTSDMVAFYRPTSTSRQTQRLVTWNDGPPKLEFVADDAWEITLLEGNRLASFAFPVPTSRALIGSQNVSFGGRTVTVPAFDSLPLQQFSPAWAPDGREIVYKADDGLYRSFVGTPPGRSLGRIPNTDWNSVTPQWSPDGKRILLSFRQHDHWEIGWISADGASDLQLLTRSAPFTRGANNAAGVWSPDGTKIAFVSDREQEGIYKIYVMNADGSDQRKLIDVPIRYDGQFERSLYWGR